MYIHTTFEVYSYCMSSLKGNYFLKTVFRSSGRAANPPVQYYLRERIYVPTSAMKMNVFCVHFWLPTDFLRAIRSECRARLPLADDCGRLVQAGRESWSVMDEQMRCTAAFPWDGDCSVDSAL